MRLMSSVVVSIGMSLITTTSDANDGVSAKSRVVISGPAMVTSTVLRVKFSRTASTKIRPAARVKSRM